MRTLRFPVITLLASGLALAAPAMAAPSGSKDVVKVNLQVFKVKVDGGKESLVEGKTAKPGEVLEYQATYSNTGAKPVSNLQATLPVPQGMVYVPKSANPIVVQASTDGATFAPAPLLRKKEGGVGMEPVPVEDYRALRWQVSTLGAGSSLMVSARMKVGGAGN